STPVPTIALAPTITLTPTPLITGACRQLADFTNAESASEMISRILYGLSLPTPPGTLARKLDETPGELSLQDFALCSEASPVAIQQFYSAQLPEAGWANASTFAYNTFAVSCQTTPCWTSVTGSTNVPLDIWVTFDSFQPASQVTVYRLRVAVLAHA